VLIAFFLLPARLTETTIWLTNASFALIMFLDLWLLSRKTHTLFAYKKTNAADTLFTGSRQTSAAISENSFSQNISYTHKPKLNWRKDDTAHDFSQETEKSALPAAILIFCPLH